MATEKRLIDANACPCVKCDRLGRCRPGLCEAFAEWWLSPVDAVEVVRCKDCKYRKKQVCANPSSGMWVGVELRENDYCSYGERKDNEGNSNSVQSVL